MVIDDRISVDVEGEACTDDQNPVIADRAKVIGQAQSVSGEAPRRIDQRIVATDDGSGVVVAGPRVMRLIRTPAAASIAETRRPQATPKDQPARRSSHPGCSMTTLVTIEEVLHLAPNIHSNYRQAFSACQPTLDAYGSSDSPLRVAHFMAQVLHESGGLSILYESLNYSPQRLPQVWPTRFLPKGPLDPADYAHNPVKLGDAVYGGRMGNSNPGDGYAYRGRGLLQTTGRDEYAQASTSVKRTYANVPDFVQQPDAVLAAEWCIKVAAAQWADAGCNALADKDSLRGLTKTINGGLIGLAERTEWLKKTKFVWQ